MQVTGWWRRKSGFNFSHKVIIADVDWILIRWYIFFIKLYQKPWRVLWNFNWLLSRSGHFLEWEFKLGTALGYSLLNALYAIGIFWLKTVKFQGKKCCDLIDMKLLFVKPAAHLFQSKKVNRVRNQLVQIKNLGFFI